MGKLEPGLRLLHPEQRDKAAGEYEIRAIPIDSRSKRRTRLGNMSVVEWLLDSDPSIRWHVMRDLIAEPADVVAAERARIASEGWGARLLELQGETGLWDGGTLFPARAMAGPPDGSNTGGANEERGPGKANDVGVLDAHGGEEEADDDQPWTATAPTLQVLRDLGIDPTDERVRRAIALVRDNAKWEHAGQPFFEGEVEPCINGRTVAAGSYFGEDVRAIVERLVTEQLEDGGWNCEAERGSVRASFNTTIEVLEGLLEYERATGGSPAVTAARQRGERYLLDRHLMRRLSDGAVIRKFTRFAYPPRWHYDVLRGLDYLRCAGVVPDQRWSEAVDLVRSKRDADGRWPLEKTYPGAVHFALEDGDGKPSRWNTLRAMRVLDWVDRHSEGRPTSSRL